MQQLNNLKKVNVLGDANVDMILNLSDKKPWRTSIIFRRIIGQCSIWVIEAWY